MSVRLIFFTDGNNKTELSLWRPTLDELSATESAAFTSSCGHKQLTLDSPAVQNESLACTGGPARCGMRVIPRIGAEILSSPPMLRHKSGLIIGPSREQCRCLMERQGNLGLFAVTQGATQQLRYESCRLDRPSFLDGSWDTNKQRHVTRRGRASYVEAEDAPDEGLIC